MPSRSPTGRDSGRSGPRRGSGHAGPPAPPARPVAAGRRAGIDPATRRVVARAVSEGYARIYAVVCAIPRGRVMTYGEVARAAGLPGAARVVGYALRAGGPWPRPIPWQRVVGQRRPGTAHVSIKDPIGAAAQRQLLEREGVRFGPTDAIDLARWGWAPDVGRPKPGGRAAARRGSGRRPPR